MEALHLLNQIEEREANLEEIGEIKRKLAEAGSENIEEVSQIQDLQVVS